MVKTTMDSRVIQIAGAGRVQDSAEIDVAEIERVSQSTVRQKLVDLLDHGHRHHSLRQAGD
jgi:tRNA A37 threonylcarbamoyladenosine dehydratase